jgi:hypothetical protein
MVAVKGLTALQKTWLFNGVSNWGSFFCLLFRLALQIPLPVNLSRFEGCDSSVHLTHFLPEL